MFGISFPDLVSGIGCKFLVCVDNPALIVGEIVRYLMIHKSI